MKNYFDLTGQVAVAPAVGITDDQFINVSSIFQLMADTQQSNL